MPSLWVNMQGAEVGGACIGAAGGPSQMSVELEDDSGRLWPMTYRCVPHRYSYELRAGWKVRNFSSHGPLLLP